MTLGAAVASSFEAFERAGMTVTATFTPPGGGSQTSAQVVYDAPGSVTSLGDAGVVITDPTITYIASEMAGLDHGCAITVGGVDYTVREITELDDGLVAQARLARMG